ncbi:MAG: response regulator [Sediminimonas qiaohouensis]|uniref:Response regulator n=1 Tax=Sediminimonas qiaohouensis TaxID=552061 RepID=A0A7C9HI15_9RHOB|nr:response regulator [Sediminimonas qiaohouensis]MTJ03832.1 response regulator [Sediminimonas qiaohouensis]
MTRILAVDDSRTMRSMLQATLTDAGFEVDVAEDGVDGLDKLECTAPDLIITDINMPRLDGFGFIEGVRTGRQMASVPILVLTTETGEHLKQRARASGATGWIVKPFDETKLISTIQRLVV